MASQKRTIGPGRVIEIADIVGERYGGCVCLREGGRESERERDRERERKRAA